MTRKKKRILVIGQTPPPYGGQALMIKSLIDGDYKNANLIHLEMRFSKDMYDMGSFKLYKFWVLFKTIVLAWVYRIWFRANILYYGPSGPNKLAMYRDVLLLVPIRFLFKKTIFHTHAGGTSKLYSDLSGVGKWFFRMAFFRPTAVIRLTEYDHGDIDILKSENSFIVPNGIKDDYIAFGKNSIEKGNGVIINILYTGGIYKERGIIELIEACNILKNKKYSFQLKLMGLFIFENFKKEVNELVSRYELNDYVAFIGTKVGMEKWDEFLKADIFCLPSYVPSETFGLVLIESMQFKIPVVATRWNGIPYVIDDEVSGLLAEPADSIDLANKIELLMKDENLRNQMGNKGREIFLNKFTIDKFIDNMDNIFKAI